MRGLDRMGKPNLTKTKEKYVFSYTTDKNKQKKYAYRYRYTRRDNTRKEYYKQGFSTAKDAALALTELKADLLKGNYAKIDYKDLTLNELFDIYIEHQSAKLKDNSIKQIKNAAKKMSHFIGDIRINELNSYNYRKYFLNAVENELAQSTISEYNSKINAALNFAVKNEFIIKNRVSGEQFEVVNNRKVYTATEIQIIFNFIKNKRPYMYVPVLFLQHTGVRAGEMCGIKWEDIDFENNVVNIKRTITSSGEGTPKTKNSYREIPLTEKLIGELNKYKIQQKATLLKKGVAASVLQADKFEKRFAFLSARGIPLPYQTVKKFFITIRKELKVEGAKAHAFRHTFASKLIAEGVDIATVANLLGDTIDTVQKIYVHAMENKKEEAISLLDKTMF